MTRYDTTVPPARQQVMVDAASGATVFLVDGGHDVLAVDPEAFLPPCSPPAPTSRSGPLPAIPGPSDHCPRRTVRAGSTREAQPIP